MARLTEEQATRIKDVIDKDANLVGAYLAIKGCGEADYERFQAEYKARDPFPDTLDEQNKWWLDLDEEWEDHVNECLIPDNVIGACVVGGLYLTTTYDITPLWTSNEDCPVEELPDDVLRALEDEFGLTTAMLAELQCINDTTADLAERRDALKHRVDDFVRDGGYA